VRACVYVCVCVFACVLLSDGRNECSGGERWLLWVSHRLGYRLMVAIVNQTQTVTVSKATFGKLLRDEVECIIIGFLGAYIPS